MPEIIKRTFKAKQYPKGSEERKACNCDPVHSEYMPSYRYIVREDFLMSDGTPHPTQRFIDTPFRTKAEALLRS